MFEDAAELLLYYITARDEQLHTSLLSPARWFTEKSAIELTDSIRRKKLPEEAKDDEENKKFETLGPKAVSLSRKNFSEYKHTAVVNF